MDRRKCHRRLVECASSKVHIDSTTGYVGAYLRYYGGTGGAMFGNGDDSAVAIVDRVGVLSQTSGDPVKCDKEYIYIYIVDYQS